MFFAFLVQDFPVIKLISFKMLKPFNCALLTKNIPVLITVLPHRPAGKFPWYVWLTEQISSQIKHWWRGKVRPWETIVRLQGQSLIWPVSLKPTGGWLLMGFLITNTRSFKSRWAYHQSPESWRQIWERNGWANKLFLTFSFLFFSFGIVFTGSVGVL